MSLQSFFNPKSVAVVGVSEKLEKLGSVIFQNILDSQFEGELFAVNPKMGGKKFLGKLAFESLEKIKNPVDLVVIVVPGKFVEGVIDDCVKNRTKNVIIISAGFSEIGNTELETNISQKCFENNINLLGPNCLGVIFPYVNLNASFADGRPKKGGICFVSQSGAFCTAMLDFAAEKNIGFSHFISLGNKSGISEIEIVKYLAKDDSVKIFAFYLESLKNGKKFVEAIESLHFEKPVIILEPGKSEKAHEAASSHTGSLAPNSRILEQAYEQAGVIQVFSMRELFGVLEVYEKSQGMRFGRNLAILTNAGGAGVLTTDLSEEFHLDLAKFTEKTSEKLEAKLPAEANIKNPVDIIGDAHADRYQTALEILIQDENIDEILVLLTPQRTTEIEKTAEIIGKISQKTSQPIVASFIGGELVNKANIIFEKYNIPHFRFPVEAIQIMGIIQYYNVLKQKHESFENNYKSLLQPQKDRLEKLFLDAKGKKSLPQKSVDEILKFYGFDIPKTDNFTDLNKALDFAKNIFPNKLVMKLSSPDALHKTDLKGVFLNIDSEEKFKKVWGNLESSIKIADLKEASIQVQEQISAGSEIILGINSDDDFGKIMLFGSGGIYTEVFHDTAIRVLPIKNFDGFLDDTKIGKILRGVRGESAKAISPLISTMEKMQKLVLDFPNIKSIDANPVLVTENRAVCVDFKILI